MDNNTKEATAAWHWEARKDDPESGFYLADHLNRSVAGIIRLSNSGRPEAPARAITAVPKLLAVLKSVRSQLHEADQELVDAALAEAGVK